MEIATSSFADDLLAYEHAHASPATKGLLRWLVGLELPFPFQTAAPKFDAVRAAMRAQDALAFQVAALDVVGLGPGLTPSGDDFLAGIYFVVAHFQTQHTIDSEPQYELPPQSQAWLRQLSSLKDSIHGAAQSRSTACGAAHLANAMRGDSFDALHQLLSALHGDSFDDVLHARQALLDIGSSSGADMLAGILLTLTTLELL